MSWKLRFTEHSQRDAKKLAASELKGKAIELLQLVAKDPYQSPPPFEKLMGELHGAYSRRINKEHRLVYQILDDERTVKVLRMWTHYE